MVMMIIIARILTVATKHLAKSHLEQLFLQRQECRTEVRGGMKDKDAFSSLV